MTMRHVGFIVTGFALLLQFVQLTEASCARCQLKGTLTSTSPSLVSANQVFALGFFPLQRGFGFGIWHNHPGEDRTVVWMPQQVRKLQLHGDAVFELRVSQGGVLHLFSHGAGVWTSSKETYHHPGVVLELRDDGNLVLLDATGRVVWQSFDTPTDTLLPGQQAAVKNRPLVARRGAQDWVEGRYSCAVLQTESRWFLTLNWNGQLRASSWDPSSWSGPNVPLSDGATLYPYAKGYPGADHIYLSATDGSLYARNGSSFSLQVLTSSSPTSLRRVTLDHDGVLRLYSWNFSSLAWIVESSWPQQPCAVYAQCGPFGVCHLDTSARPTCSCPEGFQFIDPIDQFQGCKRRVRVPANKCEVESEMRKIGNMVYKMASHWAPPTKNITEGQCSALCLRECECAGVEFWNEAEPLCFLKTEPFLNGGFPRPHRVHSNTYYKAYSLPPPPEPYASTYVCVAATWVICLAFGIILWKYWNRRRTPLLHPEQQPREMLTETVDHVKRLLLRMEELRKKVTIWHTQCEHLVVRCQEQVDRMAPALDIILAKTPHSMTFLCSKVVCCLLEAQELLQLCSDARVFTKAAFSLSSPQKKRAPSKFALVLRELDWTLDYILFVADGGDVSQWEWCEASSRLKYGRENYVQIMNDEGNVKIGDGARQADDREAFRTLLMTNSEEGRRRSLRRSPSALFSFPSFLIPYEKLLSLIFSFPSLLIPYEKLPSLTETNEMELEDIWRKRLRATVSGLTGSEDWFWLDKLEFTFVKELPKGASKQVNECEWLGERVAVAVLDGVSKQQVKAEADFLARVQHPNVVEFSGYAYKEKIYKQGFLVTELMEQDLGSLIRTCSTVSEGPPFALPVAVDILLQIVEAMIHLKNCGVMHRDLKPRNCLASPKFRRASIPWADNIPMFYTIKLTDFGASKLRDQNSHFHTANQGTPCYMAPEMYRRTEEDSICSYTWSADVYSFGILCFEVVTGVAPFATLKFLEVQTIVKSGGRPSFPFELPKLVKSLIERCWATDPNDRPCLQRIQRDLWQCKLDAAQLS